MRTDDLKIFALLGQALWAEPVQSERVTLDTLTIIALKDPKGEQAIEKAVTVLLQRALREDTGAAAGAADHAFYRLLPEERLILSALHVGRWSYERLGRILGKSVEDIAEIAWGARLHLASAPGKSIYLPHPSGPSRMGFSCPEYNPSRPWTQRFLDDEMQGQEKVFLQTHLMNCDGCREALGRARALYYQVDKQVPRSLDAEQEQSRIEMLEMAFRRSRNLAHPLERTFVESLQIFFERRHIRRALGITAVLFGILGARELWKLFF